MTNDTRNDTDYDDEDYFHEFQLLRDEIRKYQMAPLIVIVIIGFLANSAVIVNGFHKRKVIKHFSNYFVLSLAVADWWVICTIPFVLFEFLEGYHGIHNFFCTYIIPIRETFQGAAIFSICALAILRARQVISYPLKQFSKQTCLILVAAIWIASFVICTLPFYDGVFNFTEFGLCDPLYKNLLRAKVHITGLVCVIMSPTVIATVAYLAVMTKVVYVLGKDVEAERALKRNKRIAILLFALIVGCWISYVPISVWHLYNVYAEEADLDLRIWHVGTVLFLGSSALNPVLVLLTMPDYRCLRNVECLCLRAPRVADEFNQIKRDAVVASSV